MLQPFFSVLSFLLVADFLSAFLVKFPIQVLSFCSCSFGEYQIYNRLRSDVLLWTPTHGRAKAGRPARTYIQQLCEDTGCCPEDLPEAMNDREEWRERVRDIRATSAIWWWWWWWWILLLHRSVRLILWSCSLIYVLIIRLLFQLLQSWFLNDGNLVFFSDVVLFKCSLFISSFCVSVCSAWFSCVVFQLLLLCSSFRLEFSCFQYLVCRLLY